MLDNSVLRFKILNNKNTISYLNKENEIMLEALINNGASIEDIVEISRVDATRIYAKQNNLTLTEAFKFIKEKYPI